MSMQYALIMLSGFVVMFLLFALRIWDSYCFFFFQIALCARAEDICQKQYLYTYYGYLLLGNKTFKF